MSKTIEFEANGKAYVLELNAQTLKNLERGGFNFSNLSSRVLTGAEDLFMASFTMHHASTPMSKRKELYGMLAGQAGETTLADAMFNMAAEALENMAPSGNVQWRMGESR